jgi:class 3 adenylate cyclase
VSTIPTNEPTLPAPEGTPGAASPSVPFPAIVLYADLLGFTDQIDQCDPMKMPEVLRLAETLARYGGEMTCEQVEDDEVRKFYGKRFWAFSDSVVVLMAMGSDAEMSMSSFDARLDQLSSMALAQGTLFMQGQLMRGGISEGWMFIKDNIVLGSALAEAARLEKHVKNPFIAISHDLYRDFCNSPSRNWYAKELDPVNEVLIAPCEYTKGNPALDYFTVCFRNIDLSDQDLLAFRDRGLSSQHADWDRLASEHVFANKRRFVLEHRARIVNGMNHADPSVAAKYAALKHYHNDRTTAIFVDTTGLLV